MIRHPSTTFGERDQMHVQNSRLKSGSNVIRIWLAVVGGLIVGLMIAALVVMVLSTQLLGYHLLSIQSGSMEPHLRKGDLIVTRPTSINDVDKGEVVLFETGEQTRTLVAHRVVATIDGIINVTSKSTGETAQEKTRLLRTQGDANPNPDVDPIDADHLQGVVWFSIPSVGSILAGWPIQSVLLVFAFGTAGAWIAYEGVRFVRKQRSSTARLGIKQ
jgi:signal peptidase